MRLEQTKAELGLIGSWAKQVDYRVAGGREGAEAGVGGGRDEDERG